MIGSLPATARTLDAARRLQARTHLAADTCITLARAMAALLLVGFADMLLPLPTVVRGLFLLAWGAYLVFVSGRSQRRTQARRRAEQVAREIEAQRPDLDNALIHAVQFASTLAADADSPTARLMRREIERAESSVTHLPLTEVVERAPLQRGRRALLVVALVAVFTALLFPRAYRFEIPRLFLFWQDFPPFTLTDFSLRPENARVRPGESLLITVQLDGRLPHAVELVAGREGESPRSLPLSAIDDRTYTAQLESLTRDTWFYVSGDTGRSRRCWARVDAAPLVRKLTVTMRPPAYARRSASTTEVGANGEIQGLTGTHVELTVESDQPLSGGALTIERDGMAPKEVNLVPQKDVPAHATAAFTIERDGAYKLTLNGTQEMGSLKTPDAAKGKITRLRDETPLVSYVTPGQNVIARPDMTVPLKIEAEDDIALQRLELHRIVNKGQETARTLTVPNNARTFQTADSLDLKAMGAKPGDVIEYYATAYDNDPQGIHNANSDRYWVWVVSEEDYKKVLMQQRGPSQMMAEYRAQTDALRQLAEEQAQLAKEMTANAEQARTVRAGDTKAQSALNAKAEALRQRQRDLQDRARALSHQMRELARQPVQFDVEKGLQRKLAQIAEILRKAQQGAMQQARSSPQPGQRQASAQAAAKQLQQAAQSSGANIERTLQNIEKLLPLYQDFQRLQQLAKSQQELAQQAQQVRDSVKNRPPDDFAQSRLKSLAGQQAHNRDELKQLTQDLKQHAQDARSEAPNATQTADEVAQSLEHLNVEATMQQAQQALAQQDATNGAEQAEAARRALDSLMGEGQKGQGQCEGACDTLSLSQTGSGAGASLGQMAQKLGLPGSGQSQGDGQGSAQGTGGDNAPTPGSRPGDNNGNGANGNGQQAMVMSLAMATSGARQSQKQGGPRAAPSNDLSATRTETAPSGTPESLPKATDRDASRYPVEYRRLVSDYFKAVAGGK